MSVPRLPTDRDRYGEAPAHLLVEATHALVRDIVRRRWGESGQSWRDWVFGGSDALAAADFAAIDCAVLATGHRYAASAAVSAAERPDAYQGMGGSEGLAHPDAETAPPGADGRALMGHGDNVAAHTANVTGVALHVASSARVIALLEGGVPHGSIAIIDDAGGTLTAPILERFAAVICAGGTVRSHLGILTREYGIPCIMNARIAGIREGDRIEVETSAPARTAESYQTGEAAPRARVWRLP